MIHLQKENYLQIRIKAIGLQKKKTIIWKIHITLQWTVHFHFCKKGIDIGAYGYIVVDSDMYTVINCCPSKRSNKINHTV
jgi:hypothetical protein